MNLSREDGGRNAIQWTPSNPATHGTSKTGLIIGVATLQGFTDIFSHIADSSAYCCLTLKTTILNKIHAVVFMNHRRW